MELAPVPVTEKDLESAWERARDLFESFEPVSGRENVRENTLDDGTSIKARMYGKDSDSRFFFGVEHPDRGRCVEANLDRSGINLLRTFGLIAKLGDVKIEDQNTEIDANKRRNLYNTAPMIVDWLEQLVSEDRYFSLPLTVSVEGER